MAQRELGELRLQVNDPAGASLAVDGELISTANNVRRSFKTDPDGSATVRDLPRGTYRMSLSHQGFAPDIRVFEIRSEVPLSLTVTLTVSSVETQIQVVDSDKLVDPSQAVALSTINPQMMQEQMVSQPGRGLLDLVDSLPGWLFEANGTLHPRGSEYQVQFIVDGLPLTDNRSPAFAAPFDLPSSPESSGALRVRTAGYPAEYGRKLGGVVEITSPKDAPSGLHGQVSFDGGSFSSQAGTIDLSSRRRANQFTFSGSGFHSDRYLDPPVLANYTNDGLSGSVAVAYERDFSAQDRLRFSLNHNAVSFLVPTNCCNSSPVSGRAEQIRRQPALRITSDSFRALSC